MATIVNAVAVLIHAFSAYQSLLFKASLFMVAVATIKVFRLELIQRTHFVATEFWETLEVTSGVGAYQLATAFLKAFVRSVESSVFATTTVAVTVASNLGSFKEQAFVIITVGGLAVGWAALSQMATTGQQVSCFKVNLAVSGRAEATAYLVCRFVVQRLSMNALQLVVVLALSEHQGRMTLHLPLNPEHLNIAPDRTSHH